MRHFVVTGACGVLMLTASCTDYSGYGSGYDAQEAYEAPLAAGQELAPISSNRFTFIDGQDVVGQVQIVRARDEDTFVEFARAYGLGYDELIAANPGVDPWLPGKGTAIVLPTQYVLPNAPRRGIVMNIASKRLFYYPPVADGEPQVVETFPIGIGRTGWATPTGVTTVTSKARDPIWYVPRSVRKEYAAAGDPLPPQVPPGPDNPLGRHALGLGMPGYLIHGTNKPAGVGMRVSHGCIRLYPEDIEYVFAKVGVGTDVRIVNQPYLFGWRDDQLYLEPHAPLDEDEREWADLLLPMAQSSIVESAGADPIIAEQRLQQIADDQRGYPIQVGQRGGESPLATGDMRRVVNILASGDTDTDTDSDTNGNGGSDRAEAPAEVVAN